MRMSSCHQCSKEFRTKQNLYRHEREVHNTEKTHGCGICGKRFARKSHKTMHLRTCSRKVLSSVAAVADRRRKKVVVDLHFTPTLRLSAFGGCFADWKIVFPRDYDAVDLVYLLSTSTAAMKDTIAEHLLEHTKQLKFTMSLHVVFEKANIPEVKTVPPVVLTTNPHTVYLATNLDSCLENVSEELFEMIEQYESNGSGWVLDHIARLDTNITSFSSI